MQCERSPDVNSGVEALRAKKNWIVALGVIYATAALIALCSITMTTASSILVVGIMMMIAGTSEVINACQLRSWSKFVLWLALGALYIVAGIATFENPILTVGLLTIVLGASLVVSGSMRLILGFSLKMGTPWGWVFLSGVITLLLG